MFKVNFGTLQQKLQQTADTEAGKYLHYITFVHASAGNVRWQTVQHTEKTCQKLKYLLKEEVWWEILDTIR